MGGYDDLADWERELLGKPSPSSTPTTGASMTTSTTPRFTAGLDTRGRFSVLDHRMKRVASFSTHPAYRRTAQGYADQLNQGTASVSVLSWVSAGYVAPAPEVVSYALRSKTGGLVVVDDDGDLALGDDDYLYAADLKDGAAKAKERLAKYNAENPSKALELVTLVVGEAVELPKVEARIATEPGFYRSRNGYGNIYTLARDGVSWTKLDRTGQARATTEDAMRPSGPFVKI